MLNQPAGEDRRGVPRSHAPNRPTMLLGDATQMLFRCEMLLGDPDALCHESLEMLLGDATQMPFGVRCSWEIQMLFGMRCFVLHGGNYQLHSFGDALGRCSSDSTAQTLKFSIIPLDATSRKNIPTKPTNHKLENRMSIQNAF